MIFSFLWPFLQRKAAGRRFAVVWLASPHYPSQDSKHDSRYLLIYFNPRSLCGERYCLTSPREVSLCFQSTLPVKGAIPPQICTARSSADFNPRSPHGERFEVYQRTEDCITIFQSTLPSRGAIFLLPAPRQDQAISIHAPLAGSDWHWKTKMYYIF